MKIDRALFDDADPQAEVEADARAEADVAAGRTIGHNAVRHWLRSWGTGRILPKPHIGD
ncbi:CopG family transcriptional regulator [Sphingomonas sp. ID0503]|uniref:CopG family transcriptional regulator n=1 Tax=Sphingomonas sp. ID0503 TaxID=3399691 RepID=UPI003AFB02E7